MSYETERTEIRIFEINEYAFSRIEICIAAIISMNYIRPQPEDPSSE